MGHVYRARDTRLNRTIALKISKQGFDAVRARGPCGGGGMMRELRAPPTPNQGRRSNPNVTTTEIVRKPV